MPGPLRASQVSDQVFRTLVDGILSERYAPGERLPTQRALAADLGVNVASVREAVKRLEQLRLVDVRHGDAMRVRDWRAFGGVDVLAHVLFAAGGLDGPTLAALMEARRALLVAVARLAAEHRSDERAARLTELAERIACCGDGRERQALDYAFMAELIDAAGNIVFTLVMNSIRELYFERAELFEPMVADRSSDALYARAATAVSARDAGAAADAIDGLAALHQETLR